MSTYTKGAIFEKAIEVIKAYATGGGTSPLHLVLKSLYEEMMRINDEPESAR